MFTFRVLLAPTRGVTECINGSTGTAQATYVARHHHLKHYTVSFEYPGPSPSLKGAGDNDLPVKGVVDLEFKVGKSVLGRNSFECDLNLRPFGNWLEDSPWQC